MTNEKLQIAALKRGLKRAQRRLRRYVEPGRSLADELIAERREEAKREAAHEDRDSQVSKKP